MARVVRGYDTTRSRKDLTSVLSNAADTAATVVNYVTSRENTISRFNVLSRRHCDRHLMGCHVDTVGRYWEGGGGSMLGPPGRRLPKIAQLPHFLLLTSNKTYVRLLPAKLNQSSNVKTSLVLQINVTQ